jgi:hypothetical protein
MFCHARAGWRGQFTVPDGRAGRGGNPFANLLFLPRRRDADVERSDIKIEVWMPARLERKALRRSATRVGRQHLIRDGDGLGQATRLSARTPVTSAATQLHRRPSEKLRD